MTTTDKILCLIENGGTLDELAKVLGLSKSLLVARIEFLVRAGYLCEIRSGNGCGGGANCKSCGVPVPGRGDARVKMYMLTEKVWIRSRMKDINTKKDMEETQERRST